MHLSLWQRLSVAFAALLLACCGLSAWLQVRAGSHLEQEVVQRLSKSLAGHIAEHAALLGQDALNPRAVHDLFDMLMVVNPSVEVYLLDASGHIQAHAAPNGRVKLNQIDLSPVRRFLADEPLPILGDDPRGDPAASPRGKIFSAAPLRSADGQALGYVYVVLLGEAHDALAQAGWASAVLRTTLWSMALVATLGLASGLVAFALITRRLRKLTAAVGRIESEGVHAIEALPWGAEEADTSKRTRDEITLLQRAFQKMAQRVGDQWRELVNQDQQRREMVANISHDLRTPLTSLHGYLETLAVKSATLDEAARRRYLDIALAQSRKVGRLAQELFELARLEHGAVKPDKECFSLAELVQDVFQKFDLAAESRGLTLSADFAPGLPAVCADLGMIERVLTNLLDNAIRHTPASGEIKVQLRHSNGQVAVQIEDTGPGIPESLRSGLFTRTSILARSRYDIGTGPQTQGGLGLLIVRRILQLHGSDIQLLQKAEQGAVFEFGLQAVD